MTRWRPSVAEVPPAGEDERCAGRLDRRHRLAVPDRAARLDQRGDAGIERELRAVGEGEVRVARKRGPGGVVAVLAAPSRSRSGPRRRGSSGRRRSRSSAGRAPGRSRSRTRACTRARRTAGRPTVPRRARRSRPASPRGPRRRCRAPARAGRRARACSRARPPTPVGGSRSTRMRSAFFARSASTAAASYSGASSTSAKCSPIRAPSSGPTGRFSTATQPNAETGSAASARSQASSIVSPTATPQGFACLTITAAGSVSSRAMRRAPSRSPRLLYESSLPPSCSIPESRCRRAPSSR